eukprot:13315008-Ditylum_brightwellii.AAC.1
MDKEMSSTKSVRLPSFDGNAKLFQMWWLWFLVYTSVYGFTQSMQHTINPDLPDSEAAEINNTNTLVTAAAKKAKRSNVIEMAKWPSGLTYKIMVALHEKYAPQDMVAKIKLRRVLNSIIMKKKDVPGVLFKQISGLQNWYNTASFQVSLEEQIAAMPDKTPTEYSTVLTCKQRQKGSALSMKDQQLAMTQMYCTMYGEKRGSSDEMPEVGLATTNGKIKCYNCSKKGHKAFQCKEPKKKGKGKKKSNKKFNQCRNKGHDTDNCWDDPKNADNVPAWYKQKKEAGRTKNKEETGLFCGEVEVLLMANDDAMHFPGTLELLLNPAVWLTDT